MFLFNHPTSLGGATAPRKAMAQGGYRGYRLAGRWRPSPLGGRFKEIRFGDKKNTPSGHEKSYRVMVVEATNMLMLEDLSDLKVTLYSYKML